MKALNEINMYKKILKVIKTSRPTMWLAHFGLFTIGAINAPGFNVSLYKYLIPIFLLSFPYSLFIYSINDAFDINTDNHNSRKGSRYGEQHKIEEKTNLIINGFLGLIPCIVYFLFFDLNTIVIFITTTFFLGFYSIKPIRFKGIPILDLVTGGFIYGLGLSLLGYNMNAGNLSYIPNAIFFVSLILLLLQMMGSILDYVPDKKDRINTSSVFFGYKTMIVVGIFTLLFSLGYFIKYPLLIILNLIAVFFFSLLFSDKVRFNEKLINQITDIILIIGNLVVLISLVWDNSIFIFN